MPDLTPGDLPSFDIPELDAAGPCCTAYAQSAPTGYRLCCAAMMPAGPEIPPTRPRLDMWGDDADDFGDLTDESDFAHDIERLAAWVQRWLGEALETVPYVAMVLLGLGAIGSVFCRPELFYLFAVPFGVLACLLARKGGRK